MIRVAEGSVAGGGMASSTDAAARIIDVRDSSTSLIERFCRTREGVEMASRALFSHSYWNPRTKMQSATKGPVFHEIWIECRTMLRLSEIALRYCAPAHKNRYGAWLFAAILCSTSAHGQQDAADIGATSAAESAAEAQLDQPIDPEQAWRVSRFEAKLEFDRLVAQEDYAEAAPVGEQLLVLTEQEFGADSKEVGDALVSLAETQTHTADHEASENNFLRAIDIYQRVDGVFSGALLRPLLGLGDNFHVNGDYLGAVTSYNEARTVSRRIFGLLDEGQIDILDRLTASFVSMNQFIEADQQQLAALTLVERNHGPDSVELLESLYKYATWLRSSGRYSEERFQYSRAIRIVRESFEPDSVLLVKPLQETGNSYRDQRLAVSQGISSLKQALEILEALEEPEPLLLAEVFRDLGDWQVAFTKIGHDGTEYSRAWELLADVPSAEDLRTAWFSGIAYVFREPMSQRGLSTEPTAVTGSVLVKFDIDPSGRTANVQILESDPPGFKDEAVARHVRLSRFRPHMQDGIFVAAKEMALQVNFQYQPDEILEAEVE